MPQLTIDASVGQWVAQDPATARVFEALKIDYCCGGKKPLARSCQERELDPAQVVQQLHATASRDNEQQNWGEQPLVALCDHIEQTHHAYLTQELLRLTAIIAKVVRAHGERNPTLVLVQQAFINLRRELEPHMLKEERLLFPAIRRLESSESPPIFPFGSVANPIYVMEEEHDYAGECLARIRELTSDYQVPEGACNTYRVMLDSLQELEADMHQHVHKENNFLFPRARALEAQVGA